MNSANDGHFVEVSICKTAKCSNVWPSAGTLLTTKLHIFSRVVLVMDLITFCWKDALSKTTTTRRMMGQGWVRQYRKCVACPIIFGIDNCIQIAYTANYVYILYTANVVSSTISGIFSSYITIRSLWVRWRLKSSASRLFTPLFILVQIKENIKAQRYWPLWGEFPGEFPAQRASNGENASIWWRNNDLSTLHRTSYLPTCIC